jgi:glycosyltransferase involved in cell wall biosynthesis
MIGGKSVAVVVPAYNEEALIDATLAGIPSFVDRIVVVDDASTDATAEVCARYVQHDSRVSYARNDRRLGLSRNWQRAFELAGERHPAAHYFAWASDHDIWGPRWHERLAAELEAHDEAVLAYPFAVRVDDAGSEYPTRERVFYLPFYDAENPDSTHETLTALRAILDQNLRVLAGMVHRHRLQFVA